ncbi:MAG: hypothetical protein LBQ27_05155 [Clostridiales bacterium]|nr:hypothetical protein [Clostridiales bacterium]
MMKERTKITLNASKMTAIFDAGEEARRIRARNANRRGGRPSEMPEISTEELFRKCIEELSWAIDTLAKETYIERLDEYFEFSDKFKNIPLQFAQLVLQYDGNGNRKREIENIPDIAKVKAVNWLIDAYSKSISRGTREIEEVPAEIRDAVINSLNQSDGINV